MTSRSNPLIRAIRRPHWPKGWRDKLGPFGDWIDMVLIDHGFLRAVHPNFHKVTPELWRSAQPGPGTIAMLKRRGLKTIINLRGASISGSCVIEAQACRRLGIELIDLPMKSKRAPEPGQVVALAKAFDTIAYPALIHCKSGADRASFAAALFLILHEHRTLDEARAQLSWRYGHVKSAQTGVLDHFIDEYEKDHTATGRTLLEWVQSSDYDAKAMTARYRGNVMANVFVNRVLGRE